MKRAAASASPSAADASHKKAKGMTMDYDDWLLADIRIHHIYPLLDDVLLMVLALTCQHAYTETAKARQTQGRSWDVRTFGSTLLSRGHDMLVSKCLSRSSLWELENLIIHLDAGSCFKRLCQKSSGLIEMKPCYQLAASGKINCIKAARECGQHWSEFAPQAAAAFGQLECLRFLHENGCPWSSTTILYAATSGHRPCLEYADKEGCPWPAIDRVRRQTARNRHEDCLAYIQSALLFR
jgi:hypothetical protein